ncbi:MAG: phosphatidate cytidylyltransferase [Oscillospiraceae bacterium]|nr:phosphatidate cytidylyltransferase [Oscillospiraceae bacterium]
MRTRVITSVASVLLFFVIFLSPGVVFNIALAAISSIMLYELLRAVGADKTEYTVGFVNAAAVLSGIFYPKYLTEAIIAVICISMLTSVFTFRKGRTKTVYITNVFSMFIAFFMSCIAKLRAEYGSAAVFVVFLSAWMTDIGGFFGGYFFGRHKLSPNVSPKKTVEGAIGGVVLCVVLNVLYAVFINYVIYGYAGFYANYALFAVMAAAASVSGQLGDLSASVIKREYKIKDYGTIFPGHGGVMDRFDSVVFIAPCVYYFMKYFIM